MICKSLILFVTIATITSVGIDVIGRIQPFAVVVWDSNEAFAMVLFSEGQIEARSLMLGETAGINESIVSLARAELEER